MADVRLTDFVDELFTLKKLGSRRRENEPMFSTGPARMRFLFTIPLHM
jgi:hypothetical protein